MEASARKTRLSPFCSALTPSNPDPSEIRIKLYANVDKLRRLQPGKVSAKSKGRRRRVSLAPHKNIAYLLFSGPITHFDINAYTFQEYNACLSRIRSFLAGTRSHSSLTECQRLLESAKKTAAAMQAMAEVEGNPMKIREAKNLLERDIGPLSGEVEKQLNEMSRQELFYQAPDIEGGNNDMDHLINSSDALLRESQSILAETEQIGTSTLQQMGRQREQLENSNRQLDAVLAATRKAKNILVSMSWRAWKSKMALYCMIALLSAANLYVLHRNFKKKHADHDDSDADDNDD